MKKFKNFIIKNKFTTIFLLFLISVSLFGIVKEDVKFSSIENKLLAQYKKPTIKTIFDKTYMSNLETYTSDQFPYRNELISLNTNVKRHAFLEHCINNVYFGKDDYLFVKHKNEELDKEQIKTNVENLNKFKETYGARIFMIPSGFEVLDDKLPMVYQNANPNELLKDVEDIEYVDNVLLNHKDEYIYYKTDHHWTTYGAYCLYKEISENPIEYNVELVSSDFLGTTHSKVNIGVKKDEMYAAVLPINIEARYDFKEELSGIYFDKYLEEKDKYSYYLDGNHAFIEIVNNDVKDGNLLIVKDSYANCFIPFLINDYHKINVVDLRFLNLPMSTLIKQNNYTDIIVMYNKVNFMTDNNIFKLNR